jgi:hypothetical protein
MSDYWGVPEVDYELSILQCVRNDLIKAGFSVLSEKVEVCSGAGALTMTAILKKDDRKFGLYLRDSHKQRKSKGRPVIEILRLQPGMKSAEDMRHFVLSHQHDFISILAHEDIVFKDMVLAEFNRIYSVLYEIKIKDLYEIDMSKAADGLRKRFRKQPLIEALS